METYRIQGQNGKVYDFIIIAKDGDRIIDYMVVGEYVGIVSVPAGEAPLEIRQKWVGLILPVCWHGQAARPQEVITTGVLSGLQGETDLEMALASGIAKKQLGYEIHATVAVEILNESAPEATEWWKVNVPGLFGHHHHLVFNASECVPVNRMQ